MTAPKTPRATRIFSHPDCLRHEPPSGFAERPERLRAVLRHFEAEGTAIVRPRIDAAAALAAAGAVHDQRYVERLRAAATRGDGVIDSADNPLSPGTWDAAVAAIGTTLEACDWTFRDMSESTPEGADVRRHAFVAVRPPGHHATAHQAMGFCYFNNAAAAAQHVLASYGVERVAVLDFDVHHGNGTQDIFWRRGDVFYASSHQSPFYPGTGRRDEIGEGEGVGATFNVPMAAGTNDDDFLAALDDEMLPRLRAWRPEALLVSAGFDAWQRDPLGGMKVSLEGFAAVGRSLGAFADECCGGRLVSLLEGGYDVESLPALIAAYCRGVAAATRV